jgi:L-serine dehydratase
MYRSLADAIRDAEAQHTTISAVALAAEARDQGRPIAEIRDALRRALTVMRGAVDRGMVGDLRSTSELVGGDAAKLRTGPAGPLAGTPFRDVLARALAVQEVNAAMGVIVAAPTAGGAGVLPAVLTGLAAARGIDDEKLIDALATAGLIGAVVAERASLSGAEGGCQAETGAAAGMAAGAAVEMLGGTPRQVGHATALAQQGTLGLVCDPLGGLVELPCVFRNATGAAIALAAIEMAMAGIEFAIPADEVIDTMGEIGASMDVRYRETAGGGLAATPTGRRLAR